jgi:hypothetical protein
MKATKRFAYLAIGGLAALALVGTAKASTIVQSGQTYDGWNITLPAGVDMEVDGANTFAITLEKQAVFLFNQGLTIQFLQESGAAQNIQIIDLSLTNATNSPWSGFQELLQTNNASGTGTVTAASFTTTFDASTVGPYFTTSTITNPQEIDFGGGIWPNAPTSAQMGVGSTNPINIDASPSTDGGQSLITLKEIPIPASVPVPAALWTGLIGLGLVLVGKKATRKLA